MKLSYALFSAILALSASALPAPHNGENHGGVSAADRRGRNASRVSSSAIVSATAAPTATAVPATPPPTAGGGEGGEEGEENEVEQEAQFGEAVELGGGNIKTDTLFPAGTNGVFEVEFQNQEGRSMIVTENKSPAAPPPGFKALEPVSYKVAIAGGGTDGLTLQKIDYILTADNTLDISAGQIGRFCPEANGFVIGAGVGELEFELEENELTLTVDSLVGEWGIFVPDNAAAGGAGAGVGAEAGAGTGAAGGACGAGTTCRALLDALQRLSGRA
ncbi:hypothetical protein QC763_115540 [Podospora pseudopauciseta]|uniref:Accumulation-associated protein n=1 Tax=Podospora pseudopauciseta TaxID=2093780 RepID=A0ABR0I0F9_9PEZI|nr:hypothetical protein QC763_115540 [Podospora pseudopauciseta]